MVIVRHRILGRAPGPNARLVLFCTLERPDRAEFLRLAVALTSVPSSFVYE